MILESSVFYKCADFPVAVSSKPKELKSSHFFNKARNREEKHIKRSKVVLNQVSVQFQFQSSTNVSSILFVLIINRSIYF